MIKGAKGAKITKIRKKSIAVLPPQGAGGIGELDIMRLQSILTNTTDYAMYFRGQTPRKPDFSVLS